MGPFLILCAVVFGLCFAAAWIAGRIEAAERRREAAATAARAEQAAANVDGYGRLGRSALR